MDFARLGKQCLIKDFIDTIIFRLYGLKRAILFPYSTIKVWLFDLHLPYNIKYGDVKLKICLTDNMCLNYSPDKCV